MPVKDTFATAIKPNGVKFFNYSVVVSVAGQDPEGDNERRAGSMRRNKNGKGGHVKYSGRNPKPAHFIKNPMREQFAQMLEAKLIETGYCHAGYMELDHYFDHRHTQMRGECKDGATQEDRVKFPNREHSPKISVINSGPSIAPIDG